VISKKLEPTNEVCIKFTDDELKSLGINIGDKFSIYSDENGITLKKHKSIEIDLSEYPRELLEYIIVESNRLDITVSEFIVKLIEKQISEISKCDISEINI